MKYQVEEKYKETIKVIMANTSKELREMVVKNIIVSIQMGYAHPQLVKAGLLQKTRSRVIPVTTTDYGEAMLRTTDMGLAYVSLGKL